MTLTGAGRTAVTESGRSLAAHHSVLIFEVLESASLPQWEEEEELQPDDHELVQELGMHPTPILEHR